MKVNGALSLTAGDYDDASYEVKYISGADYTSIPVESAASIFNGGSNTFNDDTNLIAVKVKGLKPDGSMTFELPIKAPSYIQQEYAYNQMGAQTAYVYQSANGEHSYASFRCSEEDNMLRLSYRYPEWDLKFQNLKDNGDGTVSELTEPVISDITNIRDNDPVLKHGTTGDYPNLKILAADPVLISHTFGGYFLDKEFTKPFVPYDGTNPDEATKITADTTVYVKWVEDPCQLTVSKIISDLGGDGGYANLNDEFTLTINIKAADGGASIHSEFEYEGAAISGVDKPDDGKLTIDSDGNATITLKHGQSIIIKGLLREQRVTVTETEKDNYEKPTISITGKDDLEAYATGQFALSEDETTVKFSNKYTSVTPTGVGSASMVFVYIIIGLILIAAALYLIRRKFV